MASKAEEVKEVKEVKKRLPGWMFIPGGPKEPNNQEFRSKMSKLGEKKRALIAEVKELRASLVPRGENDEINKELDKLRQRMEDIDGKRKAEQELRVKKNEEIQRMKKAHYERLSRLRELSDDLGDFRTVKEIEEAIAFLTRKMETSGGGLAAEKRTLQQLSKLEEAKRCLVELQPLTDAVADTKNRENMLQREWMEINERLRNLRSEYNEQRTTKQQKELEKRSTGVNRTEVYKKCDAISSKITKLDEEMNQLREEHNKALEAWNAWREEAREKYAARVKERQQRYFERKNAEKLEEKRARALLRQNPYAVEIDACRMLVQYLRDKKVMVQREEAELARQEAIATFDPSTFLPKGAVVLNDGKKFSGPHKDVVGKKQKRAQKENKAKAPPKNRLLQKSGDKLPLFQLIGMEAPTSLNEIDAAVEKILIKQKEYESHIKTGELELSSDEEEENENGGEHGEKENEVVEAENEVVEAENEVGEAENEVVEAENEVVEAENEVVEVENKETTDKLENDEEEEEEDEEDDEEEDEEEEDANGEARLEPDDEDMLFTGNE